MAMQIKIQGGFLYKGTNYKGGARSSSRAVAIPRTKGERKRTDLGTQQATWKEAVT
jgi:hypothetical protein